MRRWRPDILHTHHYDATVIGWLASWLYPRVRLVVGRHYSDAIYRSSTGLKQKAYLGVEQMVNRAAARIIVPASTIRELLTKRQGVPADKVEWIPYGSVPDKYVQPPAGVIRQVRARLGLEGRFAVATFGRLHEEKGHRYLVEAASRLRSRLPRLTVLVAGEGPERPALESQVRAAGLEDRVRLLGWQSDAMSIMAAVDAVVQPSLQEAFSQVMYEALWMGKPLVMTDVSGAVDVIRDGHNGLLVPRHDPGALAGAIEQLAGDPGLRARLAAAGRAHVEEHLAIDKIIPRYELAYLKVLGLGPNGRPGSFPPSPRPEGDGRG
jgi:glycosyltransferase involved in cell wall biosynthesis